MNVAKMCIALKAIVRKFESEKNDSAKPTIINRSVALQVNLNVQFSNLDSISVLICDLSDQGLEP